MNTLVAFDDRGQATRLADAPFNASSGKVSPDGRRIAVDPDGATQQIAILDFARNAFQRVTFERDNASPLWVPRRLAPARPGAPASESGGHPATS